MKVGMIQSNFIPWRGYFDFIDDVDLFIFYDDVYFGHGPKWRNRNKIKTKLGWQWLTVPLESNNSNKIIEEVKINYNSEWFKEHYYKLYENYHKSLYWKLYIDDYYNLISRKYKSISELNITLCVWIMKVLNIDTEIKMSSDYNIPYQDKKIRPLELLHKAGATSYISGPNTKNYTNPELFKNYEIKLEFKRYNYEPYKQLWSDFYGEVTILDLIFNIGPNSRKYLKSLYPNEVLD